MGAYIYGVLVFMGANNGCNILVAYNCVEKINCSIPYSRKLSQFRDFVTICEVFSAKFGWMASFGGASKQSVKVFSAKTLFFTSFFL